jgi:hypothetical protein
MDGWLAGLVGGLIATVAMTAVMMPFMRGVPPGPSFLFARVTGRAPESLMMPGVGGHLAYGAVAGLVFGSITVRAFGWTLNLWGWGLLFGLILMAIAVMFLGPVSGMTKAMEQKMGGMMKVAPVMMGAHLVYGVVLGALVGAWAT